MKILYVSLAAIFFCTSLALSAELYKVVKDQAKVRVDSTVLSDSLGLMKRGDTVKVVGEKFDWYQVVLPKTFPCYVFKKLTEPFNEEKIRIIAAKVNLRSRPSLEAPIIGTAPKNGIFPLIADSEDWLKIENNSQAKGWIHKVFLDERTPAKDTRKALAPFQEAVEGTVN